MSDQERLFDVVPPITSDETRVCTTCDRELDLELFAVAQRYDSGHVRHRSNCLGCYRRHDLFTKQFRKSGQYAREFERCGGRCACCGDAPKPGTSLHVDHDHRTMEFRGLLCERCNVGGGKLGDAERALQWALYLIRTGRAA